MQIYNVCVKNTLTNYTYFILMKKSTLKKFELRTVRPRYFKLHFIDFYNDNGEKGNPKFDIQEL